VVAGEGVLDCKKNPTSSKNCAKKQILNFVNKLKKKKNGVIFKDFSLL
jgi:hypothetical protein